MNPQPEPPEITSLKTCIRELIKAGDSMALWYTQDNPKRMAWKNAREAATKAVDQIGKMYSESRYIALLRNIENRRLRFPTQP